MFGYQLLHLTVAGLCTRSALCAIVPTADTQIGINPVNDLGPISAWYIPLSSALARHSYIKMIIG